MSRETQITNYLLARLVARVEGSEVASVLQDAIEICKQAEKKPEPDIDDADVLEVYKAYPTTDVSNQGRSTGKCSRDKSTIRTLLKTHTKEALIRCIENYVYEARVHGSYIKNFSTFLHNLPEEDLEPVLVDQAISTPTRRPQ